MSDSLRPYGLPGSSVHGILQARTLEFLEGCYALFQGIFLTQRSNPCLLSLLHWQVGSLPLGPPGKPKLWVGAAKSLQSCPTLWDPIDGSPPGSTIPGILQARTLECHFLLQCMKVKSESEAAQSCLTLSDPMYCSPSGSSVHGIFQARLLQWVAISYPTVWHSYLAD